MGGFSQCVSPKTIPHHLLHSSQDFLHPDDFLNPPPFLWWSSDTACPQAELLSPLLCTSMPSDQNHCPPSLNLWSPHLTFLVFVPSLTSQILNLPFSFDLLLPLDRLFHLLQPLPVSTPGTWSLPLNISRAIMPPEYLLPHFFPEPLSLTSPCSCLLKSYHSFIFFLILSQINDDLETSSFLTFKEIMIFSYSNTLAKTRDLYIKIHLDDPMVVSSCQASVFTEFRELSKTRMKITYFWKIGRHKDGNDNTMKLEPNRAYGFCIISISKDWWGMDSGTGNLLIRTTTWFQVITKVLLALC